MKYFTISVLEKKKKPLNITEKFGFCFSFFQSPIDCFRSTKKKTILAALNDWKKDIKKGKEGEKIRSLAKVQLFFFFPAQKYSGFTISTPCSFKLAAKSSIQSTGFSLYIYGYRQTNKQKRKEEEAVSDVYRTKRRGRGGESRL